MNKTKFKQIIWNYYKNNKRSFPWRETTDLYNIIISEIMLQQTQTHRVQPKYEQFIQKFPDMESLAKASFSEVLKLWSGLGYNRRAMYLHKIVQNLVNKDLPDDPKELQKLPGLGKATAASIIVFSRNIPLTFIETNIRRVYIHFFFKNQENISDKDIEPLVEETVDEETPREWYYALMDYGVYLAKTVPNSNKKSKHYAKQSNFETSIRKIRGEIVRQLLNAPLSHQKLAETIKDQRFTQALQALLKDGIIRKKNQIYSIA